MMKSSRDAVPITLPATPKDAAPAEISTPDGRRVTGRKESLRGGARIGEDFLERLAQFRRLERAAVDRSAALAAHDVEHVVLAAAVVEAHFVLVDARIGPADPEAVLLVGVQFRRGAAVGVLQPLPEFQEHLAV